MRTTQGVVPRVASRTAARRHIGSWVFLFSKVLWVCWGWQDGAWALIFLIFLNLCLALMNGLGILKKERP